MKKQSYFAQFPIRSRVSLLSAFALSLSLSGTSLYATQEGQTEPRERAQQTTTQNQDPEQTLQLQGVYKAGQLLGKSVQNPKGEDLGTIDELVIDKTGEVKYAVLAHGGVLGIGAEMTAVSWKLLQLSPEADYYILNLEISKEQLADIPTFNRDHWPTEPQLTESSTFTTKEEPAREQ